MYLNRFSQRPLCLATLVAISFVLGCGAGKEKPAASINAENSDTKAGGGPSGGSAVVEPVQLRATEVSQKTPAPERAATAAPEVLLKTSLGDIRLRLNAEKAPLAVDNFLTNYVDRGFYDHTVFHYVDKGFMIAGGGYTADLQAKKPRAYIKNEADNGLKNLRGTVAMARLPDAADSANSQFFINLVDNPSLDFQSRDSSEKYGYCVFGEVVDGLDVVDRIADVAVADKEQFVKTPTSPVAIESARRVR